MSYIQHEIDRRVREQIADRTFWEVADSTLQRAALDFATREIHPMERKCDQGDDHPLGAVFYGVDAPTRIKDWIGKGKRTYRLICPECYSRRTDGR